jgi:small subunit ribosomal protein S25e
MGGTKKKPLASMEKTQTSEDEEDKSKKKTTKEAGRPTERKRVDVLLPKLGDQEFMKSLSPLKAITIYGAAKNLGVSASVAKTVITSLEGKGLLTRVGGFSGHYVWTAAS